MITNEIIARIKAHDKSEGFIDEAELAEFVALGLSTSTTPTAEQCRLLGEAVGALRDGGEWYRSAAAETYGKLVAKCCTYGMTVAQALDIVSSAVSLGCEEYGG